MALLFALAQSTVHTTLRRVLPVQLLSLIDEPPRALPPPTAKNAEPSKKPTRTPEPPVVATASDAPSVVEIAAVLNPPPAPLLIAPVSAAALPIALSAFSDPPVAVVRPTGPEIELPSSDADYLQNPKPAYPAVSKRLSEQGRVLLRVLVDANGRASDVELKTSSGFERLDDAARKAVAQWRFVPGKRGGVPQAMWFVVPVNFTLS